MGNLYELSAEFEALLKRAEAEAINADGEISEAIAKMLDESEDELSVKVENIIKYVKNLRANAATYKAESQLLAMRSKVKENKAASLEAWLKQCGITKYETTAGVVKSTKSKAVEIEIDATVPEKYTNTKEVTTPNKAELKKAILGGEVIKGITVVERLSVSVK